MGEHTVPHRQPSNPERTPEERARAAAERAARRGVSAPPPETFAGSARTREPLEDPPPSPPPPETYEVEAAPREPETAAAVAAPAAPRRAPAPAAPPSLARRPPPSRLPPQPPRRSPPQQHGRSGRRVLAVVAFLVIAAALYFINSTFQPFHGDPSGAVTVRIPPGADVAQIGERLERAGVIESARLFEANATLTRRRGKLRSGRYRLPRGMSNGAAVEALMQGPKVRVVSTFGLTIPEGRSRREVIPVIKKSGVRGDYLRATADRGFVRRARGLGAPRGTRSLEGFLFPATYELIDGATASELVDRQLHAFAENFRKIDLGAAKRKNLTRYDVLIIASMVEREAQLARERPLIAAVIYNRLKQGIPLGIDATIRYQINNWSRPLRQSELARDTPYNTRTRRGMPPTPIGNPGLSSLRAAARPARAKYLFFVRKPGKTGEHAFSSSERQFERDVARYQASRGG
jgi:UPF0755 protein